MFYVKVVGNPTRVGISGGMGRERCIKGFRGKWDMGTE